MKVKDVMMRTPAFCTTESNAGEAVEIMWNRNCGLLPIVNPEKKVAGVVTDRDVCIALGTRDVRPGELAVRSIMTGKVFSCVPEEEIHSALATMARERVRRLVVLNTEGNLEGILSMDDIVRHATDRATGKFPELSYADVVSTLQHVFELRVPQVAAAQAA
jgi:CBS domain-containing protein